MYPSCSNFGMKAYKSKNPFTATFLTADRLLRCSHDPKHYNKLLTNDGIKLVDLPIQDYSVGLQVLNDKNKTILFNASDTSFNGEFINHLISKKYYREALLEINRLFFYGSQEIHPLPIFKFSRL